MQNTDDQLNELCKNLELKYYQEERVIFEQGDKGDSYFIILEGSVDVLVSTVDEHNNEKNEKRVAILSKNAAFGDLSLLYGAPRNATIKT